MIHTTSIPRQFGPVQAANKVRSDVDAYETTYDQAGVVPAGSARRKKLYSQLVS